MAVTSPPTRQSTLVRSGAKTAAIRRGDIKISSPIELLSEEHGTMNDVFIQPARTPTIVHVEPRRSVDIVVSGDPSRPTTSSGHQVREVARSSTQRQHATLRKEGPPSNRTSVPHSVSTANRMSDPSDYAQSDARPTTPIKRRKSGFRTVLRKMFGRKEKVRSTSQGSPQRTQSVKPSSRHGYHKSVCCTGSS